MKNKNTIKCEFTSVWDDGSVVTTPCVYNENTGYCYPEVSKGPFPTGMVVEEYITLKNGQQIQVCPDCHEYVMKTVIGDRDDLSYGEYQECSDPDCSGCSDPVW